MSRLVPLLMIVISPALPALAQKPTAARSTVTVRVESESKPVDRAEVRAAGVSVVTDDRGKAVLKLSPGEHEIAVRRTGFARATVRVSVRAEADTVVSVELRKEAIELEEIVVTVTRTGKPIRDEPIPVDVLSQEEIDENVQNVPGEITDLLGETSGLRVQTTSLALGAANIRVHGLRGRYTQILADGLPLYGGQTGSLALLQIPPMDLGRIEVIKGVASALYGASALGGVINLVSRHPEEEVGRELLVNQTTRRGTDAVLWTSGPLGERWAYAFLGGAHRQSRSDIDRDGWVDLPAYRRVVVRPRLFWNDEAGRSVLLTIGFTAEHREGGTLSGATVPDGSAWPEELTTQRLDAGLVASFLVGGGRLVSLRTSGMGQRHGRVFGDIREQDRGSTWFIEVSLRGTDRGHTWVLGGALQRESYRSRDLPGFDYTYTIPSVFVQDEYSPAEWMTLSASGRLDAHSEFETFFNPRLSALLRAGGGWVARLSLGTGYFAPTPFTDETEATGLSRLLPLEGLDAERARSISLDLGRTVGPFELNGTLLGSVIEGALSLRESAAEPGRVVLVNVDGPTRTYGAELLARFQRGPVSLAATHAFIRSTEPDPETGGRREVPLTPRHAAGLVGTWEYHERGRIDVEVFYTGQQHLEDDPYRRTTESYVKLDVRTERRIGRARLFLNAENVTDVRQTRYDPLVRPTRGTDGRWTTDAWAPLDGRIINAGVRIDLGPKEEAGKHDRRG